MRLWLSCCALLFALTQGYQWFLHHTAFSISTLPLPWAILGGIGLAIASNRSLSQQSSDLSTPSVISAQAQSSISKAEQPVQKMEPASPPTSPATHPQKSSISFEIAKKSKQGSQ